MNNETLNGYTLSRAWFDFCFENPEKINPNHTAVFFFAIDHCNRLGGKSKFGFPTQMTMEAIGIKKHQTYIKYFNDLCEWGFFILVQKSVNQYSANIISLSSGHTKNGKALDKAFIRHGAKQSASIGQSNAESNSPIDKQLNNETEETSEQANNACEDEIDFAKKIITDFGFTEIANIDKLRTVSDFLKIIKNSGRLEYFREQYDNYFLFKNRYGERKHNLPSFIGKQENAFKDAKWDEANWGKMITDFENKPNGTKTITASLGSNNNSNGSKAASLEL